MSQNSEDEWMIKGNGRVGVGGQEVTRKTSEEQKMTKLKVTNI